MKKKAALLLALVMVLSLLPMNVFGQTVFHQAGTSVSGWITDQPAGPGGLGGLGTVHGGHSPIDNGHTYAADITVTLPFSLLAGRSQQVTIPDPADPDNLTRNVFRTQLELTLDWAILNAGDVDNFITNWGWLGTSDWGIINNDNAGANPLEFPGVSSGPGDHWSGRFNLPTTSSGALNVAAPDGFRSFVTAITTNGWSNTRVFITVEADQQIQAHHNASLNFRLPVRGFREENRWQDATLTLATAGDGVNLPIITGWGLRGVGLNSVQFSVYPGPRGFSSALHVPAIRITENRFGVLEGDDLWVRLVAPQFYSWAFFPTAGGSPAVTPTVAARPGATDPGPIVAGRPGVLYPFTLRARGVGNGASFNNRGTNDSLAVPRIETMRTIPGGAATGAAHGQHVLYIQLGNLDRNDAWRPGVGVLELLNLWLVPDDHAENSGEVRIHASLGTWSGTINDPTQQVLVPRTVSAAYVNALPGGGGETGTFDVYVPTAGGPRFYLQTGANRTLAASWRTDTGAVAGAVPTGIVRESVWTQTGGGFLGGQNFIRVARIRTEGQVYSDLHVGNRGMAGLTVEVHDGPRDMRTGHLGSWRALNAMPDGGARAGHDWHWNRDNEGLAHWSGVQTSVLLIEETIPGAFSVGFGSPINFQFLDDDGNPHPGIRILGVEARAGSHRNYQWTRGTLSNFHRSTRGVPGSGAMPGANQWGGANQNWMTFSGWLSALGQRLPNVAGVGRLNDTMATVYLPSQTITDVHTNLPGLLEVRFWLSLEAGFEWKYGENVDVTISGAGVTNLPNGTYTATVGVARDPITVTHVQGISEIETGALYNIIGREPLSDIVIDVNDNSAFAIGDELWLYIATDSLARNFDVNLANIPSISVNPESGLRLDTGRLINPAVAAGHGAGRAGVAFTVTRQPYGGNAPAPQITISNLFVEGQVFPNVEYHLVVSGTTIANNDQEVYATRALVGTPGGYGAAMAPMNRGIFTSLPYFAATISNVAGGIGDLIEGPGGIGAFTRASFTPETRVNVDGAYIQAVAFPLVAEGIVSTMINPRVFANFVGAQTTWDDTSRTASFSGYSVLGVYQTVSLTLDSPNITVNGVSQDIAVLAGQPQLAGRITPVVIDGRSFVPARVLANIFGVPIDFAPPSTVILG